MSRSVRIPLKGARALLAFVRHYYGFSPPPPGVNGGELMVMLEDGMRVKRSVTKARVRRTSRVKERREKVAALRAQVEKRAGGWCECGCGRSLATYGAHLDHFHGGANRRALESLEGCWMLAPFCHRIKTESTPNRGAWLARFLAHSAGHSYDAEPQRKARAELDSLALQGRGGGA